ncbi:MAG TPA: M14 family metallopeptidase [Candidatus Paceibacterota bacterium]|nr:M14 family metallopeptidase [Candidatus Paceibacterota bacterium]
MKNGIITILILIILALAGWYVWQRMSANTVTSGTGHGTPSGTSNATTTESTPTDAAKTVIGRSTQGRDIVAYHYGMIDPRSTQLLFVGGIHGGYEWNTVLLSYALMDYLGEHPDAIPAGEEVTVIPVLNPDGLAKTVGTTSPFSAASVPADQALQVAGRVNGNGVDLNRNFDCDWQANGTWQNKPVSGGTAPFSEPESQAFKSYIASTTPAAVVAYYSAAGGVYASQCGSGVSAATQSLMSLYASESGYPAHSDFTAYAVTGDMTDWLAKIGVPTISVLLTNHQDTEWAKNWAGIQAVLAHYSGQ